MPGRRRVGPATTGSPSDPRGKRQAEHLAHIVVPMMPTRLISSPFTRCLQTMELIAAKTGLEIEEDSALTPNAGGGHREGESALHVGAVGPGGALHARRGHR